MNVIKNLGMALQDKALNVHQILHLSPISFSQRMAYLIFHQPMRVGIFIPTQLMVIKTHSPFHGVIVQISPL